MIKKSFCDGWDNMLSMVITNALCMLSVSFFSWLFIFINKFQNPLYNSLVFIAACVIISVIDFAYGDSCASMADFGSVKWYDVFKGIPGALKDGILFGLLISILGIISFVGISFYWSEAFLNQTQLMGVFLGALLLWVDVFFIIAIQWFLPIRSLMHNKFFKCLKKCFIITFDNLGFSIAMLIHNIIVSALSVFSLGLFPSFAGIQIALTNALHLRLYKYDYLEEHPELDTPSKRRHIPWEELIYDDKETLGPRKFKSFLFPWKE